MTQPLAMGAAPCAVRVDELESVGQLGILVLEMLPQLLLGSSDLQYQTRTKEITAVNNVGQWKYLDNYVFWWLAPHVQ